MLLGGWVALTAVERWAEQEPWPSAVLGGLMWSCVVAGVWWFAEWTQSPLRTAREARAARESEVRAAGAAPVAKDEAPHEPQADATGPATRGPEPSTPSRH